MIAREIPGKRLVSSSPVASPTIPPPIIATVFDRFAIGSRNRDRYHQCETLTVRAKRGPSLIVPACCHPAYATSRCRSTRSTNSLLLTAGLDRRQWRKSQSTTLGRDASKESTAESTAGLQNDVSPKHNSALVLIPQTVWRAKG